MTTQEIRIATADNPPGYKDWNTVVRRFVTRAIVDDDPNAHFHWRVMRTGPYGNRPNPADEGGCVLMTELDLCDRDGNIQDSRERKVLTHPHTRNMRRLMTEITPCLNGWQVNRFLLSHRGSPREDDCAIDDCGVGTFEDVDAAMEHALAWMRERQANALVASLKNDAEADAKANAADIHRDRMDAAVRSRRQLPGFAIAG